MAGVAVSRDCAYDINFVFVSTNELGQKETQQELNRTNTTGNTVVGCSGLELLNIAACRGKSITNIVAIDINPNLMAFWVGIAKIILSNKTPQGAHACISEMIVHKSFTLFGGIDASLRAATNYIKKLVTEVLTGLSFLSSERKYRNIRKIFIEKHFQFLNYDITKQMDMLNLGAIMLKHDLTLDTFYITNCSRFMIDQERRSGAVAGIQALASKQFYLVDSIPIKRDGASVSSLVQRLSNFRYFEGKIAVPIAQRGVKVRLDTMINEAYVDFCKVMPCRAAKEILAGRATPESFSSESTKSSSPTQEIKRKKD